MLTFAPTAQAEAPAMAAAPACPAPVPATGELAAWNTKTTLTAAEAPSRLSRALLPVGRAAELTLLQTPRIRYQAQPEKPGGSVSYGGMFAFDVREAGTYRVALGSGAWIDMLGPDRKAVASTSHGHGPDCTGIRKMVDFPLTPGRYTVQLSANGEARTAVLVVRLP